jgi:hypothetical protein
MVKELYCACCGVPTSIYKKQGHNQECVWYDALDTYLLLVEELDYLIKLGQGDSEEANTLRDKMDIPWNRLTEEEKQLIK